MTLASRIEVFTQLSCEAVYGHHTNYNHTHSIPTPFEPKSLRLLHSFDDSEVPDKLDTDDWNTYYLRNLDEAHDLPLGISKRCLTDPRVLSGAARLQTIMTTTMGVLCALTAGWWGHFGERHGRTRVMAIAALGMLITDLSFASVSIPNSPFVQHGRVLLVIAPAFEGLLGGWTTLQGATSAYVSDCTSEGSRAHIFSRFMGVFFFGFALGPLLGAWIIRHSDPLLAKFLQMKPESIGRTTTAVFWVAVIFWSMSFTLSLFVFPESLEKLRARDKEARVGPASVVGEAQPLPKATNNMHSLRSLFTPLVVFAPKKRLYGRDWNMTLIAFSLFGYLLSSVSEKINV
jgi:MFS family permease